MFQRHVLQNAIGSLPVPGRASLILHSLLTRYNPKNKGQVFPSLNTLAKEAKCSVRSVQRHLSNLEKSGFLVIKERFNEKKGQQSNSYIFPQTIVLWDLVEKSKGAKRTMYLKQFEEARSELQSLKPRIARTHRGKLRGVEARAPEGVFFGSKKSFDECHFCDSGDDKAAIRTINDELINITHNTSLAWDNSEICGPGEGQEGREEFLNFSENAAVEPTIELETKSPFAAKKIKNIEDKKSAVSAEIISKTKSIIETYEKDTNIKVSHQESKAFAKRYAELSCISEDLDALIAKNIAIVAKSPIMQDPKSSSLGKHHINRLLSETLEAKDINDRQRYLKNYNLFFNGSSADEKLEKVYEDLKKTDWDADLALHWLYDQTYGEQKIADFLEMKRLPPEEGLAKKSQNLFVGSSYERLPEVLETLKADGTLQNCLDSNEFISEVEKSMGCEENELGVYGKTFTFIDEYFRFHKKLDSIGEILEEKVEVCEIFEDLSQEYQEESEIETQKVFSPPQLKPQFSEFIQSLKVTNSGLANILERCSSKAKRVVSWEVSYE